MKTKRYKFLLKDGREKIYEMTLKQRECFYERLHVYGCRYCASCLFGNTECTLFRGFSTTKIKSITEIKSDLPIETIKKAVKKKTKKVKLLCYFNGEGIFWNTEHPTEPSGCKRIPSEDKEIEVEI